MRALQAQMKSEGKTVTLSQLARWFSIPRRSLYYKPRERSKVVNPLLESKIKEFIQKHPTYGYRRIAFYLKANEKPVQRILQLRRWQVRKRIVTPS